MPILKVERSKLAHFPHGGNFLKNCLITFSLFCHVNESVDGLSKDGFYVITLMVIFQGSKVQRNVQFGYVATFWQFSQKRSDKFSLLFVYSFLGMILINCQEMGLI